MSTAAKLKDSGTRTQGSMPSPKEIWTGYETPARNENGFTTLQLSGMCPYSSISHSLKVATIVVLVVFVVFIILTAVIQNMANVQIFLFLVLYAFVILLFRVVTPGISRPRPYIEFAFEMTAVKLPVESSVDELVVFINSNLLTRAELLMDCDPGSPTVHPSDPSALTCPTLAWRNTIHNRIAGPGISIYLCGS